MNETESVTHRMIELTNIPTTLDHVSEVTTPLSQLAPGSVLASGSRDITDLCKIDRSSTLLIDEAGAFDRPY